MMRKAILRNKKTGETRVLPFVHETRKAIGVGSEVDPMWIPLSQVTSRNMMYLSEEERKMLADLGETVRSCYLYEVEDWIWRVKDL